MYVSAGKAAILKSRDILNDYIQKDPLFKTTLSPHQPLSNAPKIIRDMCRESKRVKCGPMSTVAGVLAQESLQAILDAGADEAVVDNGGDIAFFIKKPIKIGIFAGDSSITNIALHFKTINKMVGICTSSGTVGHSFSYGKADAAIVISSNIILADAAATALGNKIHNNNNLKNCFYLLEDFQEIEGSIVIFHDQISLWGELPELVKVHVDTDLITKGM
jgi:ApbE superfamily uncharacterized protein (UPF0280 family)